MQDLNDFAFFAAVVQHGGFAAAGRALGVPKSRLSRRVALLEERLGVRLLHRTTRRFALTATGEALLRHCRALLEEAEAAEALAAEAAGTADGPRGVVRLSCPPALLRWAVGDMLAHALTEWPHITLHVQASARPVDVREGGVDFALRARPAQATLPAEEIVKPLAVSAHQLLAAPALLAHRPPVATLADLADLPTLALAGPEEEAWTLRGPEGQTATHAHRPRLIVDDMHALLLATLAGAGCALLPDLIAFDALQQGRLLPVLPGWAPPPWQIQAAWASRRGMRPAARHVLDALAAGFARLARQGRCLQAV